MSAFVGLQVADLVIVFQSLVCIGLRPHHTVHIAATLLVRAL